MPKKKIVIIGAGLAGLSAAWHLKEKGLDCKVFEKEAQAGGLCRSKNIKGFTFDYDGHLLHFRNKYTLHLIKNILKVDILRHRRSSWVYSFDRYIPYPFQANLRFLPSGIATECLNDFIKVSQSSINKKNRNFLSWIKNSFGSAISKYFMLPYNKKFWRFPLNKINCEWVDKFIPKPGLTEVLDGYFTGQEYNFGYNSFFWYPAKGGISQLPEAFERELPDINKGCFIGGIDFKNKIIRVNGKYKERFDILISTIPLPELGKMAISLPKRILKNFTLLRWNSIFNMNLGLKEVCHKEKHWIYFPSRDEMFFRAGFFHNFANAITPRGRGAIYTEVSYRGNNQKNKEMAVGILKGLKKNRLIEGKGSILAQDINDIKYGYPIYDQNYMRIRKKILGFLKENNVFCCGRYGAWKYMSMEDAILSGKEAADRIKG